MKTDPDGILRVTTYTTSADASRVARTDHVHDMREGEERCIKRRNPSHPCPLDSSPEPATTLLNRMQAVEDMREGIGALVAGLVAEGFSDEQARDIVAGLWRSLNRPEGKS